MISGQVVQIVLVQGPQPFQPLRQFQLPELVQRAIRGITAIQGTTLRQGQNIVSHFAGVHVGSEGHGITRVSGDNKLQPSAVQIHLTVSPANFFVNNSVAAAVPQLPFRAGFEGSLRYNHRPADEQMLLPHHGH
jgi:hypothetical protein